MHVLYVCHFGLRTGYAQAAKDYCLALHQRGVSLEIEPIEAFKPEDLDDIWDDLLPLVRGMPGHANKAPTHVVIHTTPKLAVQIAPDFPDVQKIAYTTWETHHMPEALTQLLDERFNKIFVPSEFCAAAMSAIETHVVPHTYNPRLWDLLGDNRGRTFRFYSILSWNDRKNPVGLLKAYLSEFSSDDPVELYLKTRPNAIEARNLIAAFDRDRLPKVEIIDDVFDTDDMIEFHRNGHCFVTAARGEGWNLPAFDALLADNPIIAPSFGGHLDYLYTFGDYYPVPYSLTPAITPPLFDSPDGRSIRQLQAQPDGIDGTQLWAEPDLQILRVSMRAALENHPGTPMTGQERQDLANAFSYATVAELFERTIQ